MPEARAYTTRLAAICDGAMLSSADPARRSGVPVSREERTSHPRQRCTA
jgi:hypothetical protein